MRVVFCGGGTAGHVYPAIAMAEILKKKYPKISVHFIGRYGGDENKPVKDAGFPQTLLNVSGLNRRSLTKSIKGAFASLRAISVAKSFLHRYNPDLVIGTGGYVCFPVFYAAQQLGIPTVLHESNATPGLVTKIFAKRCKAVMLGYPKCASSLPKGANCVCTGNPARLAFSALTKSTARRILGISENEFLAVSFGGSLGAEAINNTVCEYMDTVKSGVTVIHATGRRYYEAIKEKYPALVTNTGSRILPYIENMPLYLSAADIAITRSGAMTLTELGVTGTPAILIPSPNVSGDHQTKNAMAECAYGRSLLLPEASLTCDTLASAIEEMRVKVKKSAKRSGVRSQSEVAEKILKTTEAYIKI